MPTNKRITNISKPIVYILLIVFVNFYFLFPYYHKHNEDLSEYEFHTHISHEYEHSHFHEHIFGYHHDSQVEEEHHKHNIELNKIPFNKSSSKRISVIQICLILLKNDSLKESESTLIYEFELECNLTLQWEKSIQSATNTSPPIC